MGNNINNTLIQYWTKDGIRISYLFWDLKGKNRFPDQPSDQQIYFLFNRCLGQIDMSSYQLKAINEFTPKYKYRFVILHNRKVAEYKKEQQIKKYSRESFHFQIAQQAKTLQAKKKIMELQNLVKLVELNESSIKTALKNVDKYIAEKSAWSEFIEIKGLQRFVGLLETAIKLNNQGTKTSFSSQIELLKFFRYFSIRYSKQFYSYIPRIKSYPEAVIRCYHPINTQIIAYSLSLLTEYGWKVSEQQSLISIIESHRVKQKYESLLQPFVESIIESQSIVNVYHNVNFINELISSTVNNKDRDVLEEGLSRVKYSIVLDNVKTKLETMQYSLDKATFISVYQKIYKYEVKKENQGQKHKIELLLQQNYRQSTNTLENLHQKAIANLFQVQLSTKNISEEQTVQEQDIVTYLSENDRRQYNKLILDTLTEMQKFYQLQLYLHSATFQTPEAHLHSTQNSEQQQKTQELIGSRIKDHTVESLFLKVKQYCYQSSKTHLLTTFLNRILFFNEENLTELEKFLFGDPEQRKQKQHQIEDLKIKLQEKTALIKTLIKQNQQLKQKNEDLIAKPITNTNPLLNNDFSFPQLLAPPSLQESLNLAKQQSTTSTQLFQSQPFMSTIPSLPSSEIPVLSMNSSLPSLPLPPIPIFSLGNSKIQQKKKQKRKPPKLLKACNYTIIPYERIKNSVFQQIDDTKVQLDEVQLSDLFAKYSARQSQSINLSQSRMSTSRISLQPASKQQVTLLKPDRAKNIEVVLVKLKIPKGELQRTLMSCSGKYNSQHTLQSILKIIPTREQQQILRAFEGSEEDLGVPEKFFKEIISIPQYENRLKSLLFSHIKDEIYFETELQIQQLSRAFTQIHHNSRIKYILQLSLAIGNYLNGENIKGGAWGFQIETIQRLQQVTSSDNQMNGALFLIKQLWKQFPYPIFDTTQLELYQYTSKMPIYQIFNEIKNIETYYIALERACGAYNQKDESDKILQKCAAIKNEVRQKLIHLKKHSQQLKQKYLDCAAYFCEDGNLIASDQFGKKIYQCILFVSNTEKIWKMVCQKKSKIQKHRALKNHMSYIEPTNNSKFKSNQKNIDVSKDRERASMSYFTQYDSSIKVESLPVEISKNLSSQREIIEDVSMRRQSKVSSRFSEIFQIHHSIKPLQQLSEDQKQNQFKLIQKQSINKAMESVFKRRTIKIQNINLRFSKNVGIQNSGQQAKGRQSIVDKIDFLKQIKKD